jgi:hypothetical protein
MKKNYIFSGLLFLPVYVLLIATILALWLNPDFSLKQLVLIPVWLLLLAVASFLAQQFIKKQATVKLKTLLYIPAVVMAFLLSWMITLRVSSELLGSSLAWSNKWLSLAFVIVYFAGDYAISAMLNRYNNRMSNIDNRLSMKDVELDFMKTQLNPHFLFNSLNNVAATIMVNRDLALDYTYKLSDMLRYQLGISGREMVDIVEEELFIRNYLDVEKLRLGERCTIEYISDVQSPKIQVPPFLLHPLIEQSLRRSQGLNGRSSILVKLTANSVRLNLNISFSNPVSPAHADFSNRGFEMVSKRLILLYPGRHKLTADKNKGSSLIDLVIEL